MLRVENLWAGYGGGAAMVMVLRDVSLEVHAGEIVALLGSNGAGKSTLINTITGVQRPASGKVDFDGADIASAPAHRIVSAGLIQVPEGRRVFPNLTVRENLLLGGDRARAWGSGWARKREHSRAVNSRCSPSDVR